jgi:hypothetical protein
MPAPVPDLPREVYPADHWRARARTHAARVERWLGPEHRRRVAGEVHPVQDFLFTYYSHRRARLRRWDPGFGIAVEGAAHWLTERTGYRRVPGPAGDGDTVMLDPAVLEHRRERIKALARLLAATANRPAQYGCFGLHEWAMVYRADADRRHRGFPLRLSPADTDRVVEQATITCSHFDAYRFFTDPAKPRNRLRPTAHQREAFEQPGCLHATMDLYKHAFTLWPLICSELVADCFELAFDVRALDMAASPYDLSALGYAPVPIETPTGRADYVRRQREFTARAHPLRQRLIDDCERLSAF